MSTTNPYAPPKSTVSDAAEAPADPADRLIRLAAAILDGIILGCLVYLPIIVAVAAGGGFEPEAEPSETAVAIGSGIAFIGFVAWAALTIAFVVRNGQSIAKRIVGIKVVRKDGSRASLGRIFWLRNVVNGLLGVIPLYSLIDALFIFSEDRQCLHDKIADTIVVRA